MRINYQLEQILKFNSKFPNISGAFQGNRIQQFFFLCI